MLRCIVAYQEIPAQRIPTAQTDDGLAMVKVIAAIKTRTPIIQAIEDYRNRRMGQIDF